MSLFKRLTNVGKGWIKVKRSPDNDGAQRERVLDQELIDRPPRPRTETRTTPAPASNEETETPAEPSPDEPEKDSDGTFKGIKKTL